MCAGVLHLFRDNNIRDKSIVAISEQSLSRSFFEKLHSSFVSDVLVALLADISI